MHELLKMTKQQLLSEQHQMLKGKLQQQQLPCEQLSPRTRHAEFPT